MHFLSSNKRIPFILAILLTIILLASLLLGIRTLTPAETESYHTQLLDKMEHASSFLEFTDALFCYEISSDSVTTAYTLKNPSVYHIPELSPKLSAFSYKQYNKDKREQSDIKMFSSLSNTMKRFSPSNLNDSEQITCALLQKHFELNTELSKYAYYEELLGATSGVQANLPVTLGEYPLRTEKDIKTYLTLLTQVPDYFENVISYEKHRTTLGYQTPCFLLSTTKNNVSTLIKNLKQENNCFTDTFNERITRINGLSEKKRTAYQKQNLKYIKTYVLPAYEEIYTYINTTLKAQTKKTSTDTTTQVKSAKNPVPDKNIPYGLSTLPDGKAYYALLTQNSTGSERPITELIAMTEQALKQSLGDVLNVALTDQKAYLYYCEHPMETYCQTPDAILEALSLMARENYPTLNTPPVYQVKTVSESLAPSLSPAFYMIPAIDDYENNTIYINPLYTNEKNGNLFTTLAHEGFPGHLYQTVYFNDTNPSAIRHALNFPGYVEGWATYVEMNSFTFIDYPLEGNSLCRLYQADTMINLALCSRIDMGVNYENWTLSDVCKFFEDNGFNSYYATDIYSYVVEAPSNYLSYFIGYLEIEDLKQCYKQQEMENYSEKAFHKKLLDIGPSDFTTLRNYMLVNP